MASKAVETRFTAADKVTPAFNAMGKGAGKFSVAAKAAFRSVVPEASRLNDIIKGVTIGNLLTKGITAAAGAIKSTIASIPEFAARADEIGKTSQKLGLTTDALQRYRFAAAHANVDTNVLNTAFQKMNQGLGSGKLFKDIEKVDASLAAQVKKAKTVDEAFKMITQAAKGYTDTGQRTAVMMAAFGKTGNQLVPMLGDLAEQMKNAGKHGNIISPASIAMATKFQDTMTDVKFTIQAFGDIIRGAVVRYVTPYIDKLKKWAAANREVIATKINDFVKKTVSFIEKLIPKLKAAYNFTVKFGPAILGIIAAYKGFKTVTGIITSVNVAMKALAVSNAAAGASALTAGANATTGAGAFVKLASAIGASRIAMLGLVAAAVVGTRAVWIALHERQVDKFKKQVAGYNFTEEEYDAAANRAHDIVMERNGKVTDKENQLSALRWSVERDRLKGITPHPATTGAISNLELWLKEHPRLTEEEGLDIAAKEIAAKREDPMKKLEDLAEEILGKMDEEIGAINGLADNGSDTSPARLKWGNMGMDYWETARYGV